MSYVYKRTEPTLWTVGFYDPKGKWESESDHDSSAAAAERTAYLNGSGSPHATSVHLSADDLWDLRQRS